MLAAVALGAAHGCSHGQSLRDDVQIIESGIEVQNASSVFWTSPDEVMFIAPTQEHVMDGTFKKRVSRVTTWNIRTNEVRRYAAADGGLCYDRGNIAYSEVENAALRGWISSGRHPESVTRREARSITHDAWMSCLPFDALPPTPPREVAHEFVRLRPEHGFIDLGPPLGLTLTKDVPAHV